MTATEFGTPQPDTNAIPRGDSPEAGPAALTLDDLGPYQLTLGSLPEGAGFDPSVPFHIDPHANYTFTPEAENAIARMQPAEGEVTGLWARSTEGAHGRAPHQKYSLPVIPQGWQDKAHAALEKITGTPEKRRKLAYATGVALVAIGTLAGAAPAQANDFNLRNGLEIALIVLVVLLVIIGLIVGFSRLKKDDEEEQTYY